MSELPPGAEAALEAAMQAGPGDGLPLVPPTRRAVDAMLGSVQEGPGHVLGNMAPAMEDVTVGEASVCAVAAGCKPAYFPVVLAALEAVMEPEFNFLAIQATTELASPLVIVHGPVAERLGMHSGSGCLGPGFRANATIGRAVRLAAVRLGMAVPGETDMATFGHGGKFSACFAEAVCGWEPLHATRGFRAEQSAVTVVGADAPVNVNDYASGSAESVLRMIAGTMAYPGSNNAQGGGEVLLVISPQHLGLIASGGMNREDVQRALFEHCAGAALEFFTRDRRSRAGQASAAFCGLGSPRPFRWRMGRKTFSSPWRGGLGATRFSSPHTERPGRSRSRYGTRGEDTG